MVVRLKSKAGAKHAVIPPEGIPDTFLNIVDCNGKANDSEGAGALPEALPEGIFSLLDTDLYKLTMQCAVLKYFPDVRHLRLYESHTSDVVPRSLHLARRTELSNIILSREKLDYLKATCTYLNEPYLIFLSNFRLDPSEQLELSFHPVTNTESKHEVGDVHITVKGLWVDTILYEIPLLALTSEAYFKFMEK
ncbi:nicotinate phosphoribosyltransferase [Lasallia pustulata]|uniref:Nicotinate phosphoribosyltransferase n=1 Tax=Lasallia pustulata TaxID=136370 RepID=A0A1W5DC47_9LECA|nr:nicotinate phosphoribosyltransferase [Lasallia pustulata]